MNEKYNPKEVKTINLLRGRFGLTQYLKEVKFALEYCPNNKELLEKKESIERERDEIEAELEIRKKRKENIAGTKKRLKLRRVK